MKVLISSSHEFGNGKVIGFEAEPAGAACGRRLQSNQSVSPAIGQYGGVLSDAMGVVAEGAMEWREFANGAIDQIGVVRRSS